MNAAAVIGKPNAKYDKLRKEHWAWQPLKDDAAPERARRLLAAHDIDRFVLAKLEDEGLKPVRDADKLTLIRRVTFDLTGLPPTPEEIDAFLARRSSDAFEKVVDRLLASPAFGERWGRHWLDVARYGESTGSSRNVPLPHAWRYRDYVIDAFTSDKPYDTFIREQIAGDLLPAELARASAMNNVIATGFLAIGVKDVNQRFKVRFIMDNVDEQIDAVSRSFLATTASCARCHDHKFDPIPTDRLLRPGRHFPEHRPVRRRAKQDGGRRARLLRHGHARLPWAQRRTPIPNRPRRSPRRPEAYEAARKEFEAIRGTPEGLARGPDGLPKQRPFRLKMVKLQDELLALTDPAERRRSPSASAMPRPSATPRSASAARPRSSGRSCRAGSSRSSQVPDAPTVNPSQSGRLELAQWLTSRQNPLTPRVMANRVWQHLFGQGLVKSVDNFGVTGDVPSHPELLDHLAIAVRPRRLVGQEAGADSLY